MPATLLKHVWLLFFITACASVSQDHLSSNRQQQKNSNTAITASIQIDTLLIDEQPKPLTELQQTEEGQIVLQEGYYETTYKSYCLQPGTPDPTDRDAYLQSPLQTNRKDIVETVLRTSLQKPELEQKNIQLLLWSVVSGSDYNKLSWPVQLTAQQLLTRKQIFQLKGGVAGVVKTVAQHLPDARITGAQVSMKRLFESGANTYESFERVAVLREKSVVHNEAYKKEQWNKQAGGYYLRYFPNGYQQVKVQVYVPKGTLDSTGMQEGNYLLFDPVNQMAVPANSNAQRLGIGAPVVEVIRKIIRIQRDVPVPTKKPTAPKEQPKTSKEQQ
ncbi:hypothetical protein ESA94_15850 [Lacibacter luteus]|uniref:DUF4136 domain-containing protein n=1 Tax=Lacibacter luteus TaxID=2508719 RepID=A0A4Q1CGB0_9BACT|nr:hypothetical protein [Lacibacter luteus]RXK58861.1 hypothetical protein ESA94_15850 [Lacibacter luteus]